MKIFNDFDNYPYLFTGINFIITQNITEQTIINHYLFSKYKKYYRNFQSFYYNPKMPEFSQIKNQYNLLFDNSLIISKYAKNITFTNKYYQNIINSFSSVIIHKEISYNKNLFYNIYSDIIANPKISKFIIAPSLYYFLSQDIKQIIPSDYKGWIIAVKNNINTYNFYKLNIFSEIYSDNHSNISFDDTEYLYDNMEEFTETETHHEPQLTFLN